VTETGRGVFAKRLCASYPELVVIEDIELENKTTLDNFIQSILT